jgi:hypothetical protein
LVELANVKANVNGIETAIKEQTVKLIRSKYDALWLSKTDSLETLPVESLLPMLILKHAGAFAKTFIVNPQYLEFGYDPE